MNTPLTNPTTDHTTTVQGWARIFESEVFLNPSAALDAAYDAKQNASSGDEVASRKFEDVLLAHVAVLAARERFDIEQIAAIVIALATLRGHYGYDPQ